MADCQAGLSGTPSNNGASMNLRVIPPANRRNVRVSSMRAATRANLTLVGGQHARQSPTAVTEFPIHISRPDPQVLARKQMLRETLQANIARLETLVATAIEPAEKAVWTASLKLLKDKLGMQ